MEDVDVAIGIDVDCVAGWPGTYSAHDSPSTSGEAARRHGGRSADAPGVRERRDRRAAGRVGHTTVTVEGKIGRVELVLS
jgi:hypothetical protein